MSAGVADPDGLDWWMDSAGPAEVRTGFAPQIDTLEGVLPLDPRFDQATTGCVPQQLRAPLFGLHPMPDTAKQMARSQEAGGSAAQTYALFDAAKVPNLVETLEESGLVYRCLFKDQAFEDFMDVAPWLVELDATDDLTRRLFTSNDGNPASRNLWETAWGMFFRSHATLDDVLRHFRRFTRIQNEAGKWFFFRFWEPSVLYAAMVPDLGVQPIHALYQPLESIIHIHPKTKRAAIFSGFGEDAVARKIELSARVSKALGVAYECGKIAPGEDANIHRAFVADCWALCQDPVFTEPALLKAICASVHAIGVAETRSALAGIGRFDNKVRQKHAAFVLSKSR